MEFKKAFLFNGIGTKSDKLLKNFTPELLEKFYDYRSDVFSRIGLNTDMEKNSERDSKVAEWIMALISDRVVAEFYLSKGIVPDIGAGYSSGIVSICANFGAISHYDASGIIYRNTYAIDMIENSGEKFDMGVIIGLEPEFVSGMISETYPGGEVVTGSVNSKICTMISGYENAVTDILKKAESEGALKAIKMETGMAYHNPLMEKYADEYIKFCNEITFSKPKYPIISIFNHEILTEPEQLLEENKLNVYTPIRWDYTIKKLEELGVTEFYDISANGAVGKFTRVNKRKCRIFTHEDIR